MLTKELILRKNPKYKTLEEIQTINLWGSEINDISILSKCKSLEILSLSLNNISNISPLKKCFNLRELYLRKNKISSLSQIDNLKNLKQLRILWLDENPISNLDNYKEYILKTLPQITKLDNVPLIKREMKKNKTIQRSSNIDEKKFILRRVNSNEPVQINLLMTLKEKSKNNNNNSNSSILKFNNIVSNGSFSDIGDILRQKSNSTNKTKSFFNHLNLKIKPKKEKKKIKIKIVNDNLNKETLSPKIIKKENMEIKIPNCFSNSKMRIIRNQTSVNSAIDSHESSTLNNEKDEKLTLNNYYKKPVHFKYKCNNNNKKLIRDALNIIDKMDINDLYFMKKKIEEKIESEKKKLKN